MPQSGPLVVKLGGELLESFEGRRRLAETLARLAGAGPLVIVHGGGREIDAELARRGMRARSVDGLRITGAEELPVVVAVLAGLVNTRLVAALSAAGVAAVGLTGADAAVAPVEPAPPQRRPDETMVSLGFVGRPVGGAPRLLRDLCGLGYVPVIASLGLGADGHIYNVNADTLAAHLAGALGARQLLIAGTTAGVLDAQARTIPWLDSAGIEALISDGRAHSGMVAKLAACRAALDAGLAEILIVDGRDAGNLETGAGTRIVAGDRRAGL